ncbi:MAG: potassium channel family protein [Gemmatimonadota bacterium]
MIADDGNLVRIERRILAALLALASIFGVAVVGYRIIGGDRYGWIDALYMSVIMLTTTGTKEVVPTETAASQIFTMVILVVGATAAVYTLSMLTAFVVEGDITQGFRRRRMRKAIEGMTGHVIVCGAGQTGSTVLRELVRTQRPCVVIEANEAQLEAVDAEFASIPFLHGDCSDDETLLHAGITRAGGVVICTDDDKTALVTTVLAKQLNPAVRVTARATTEKAVARLKQAGADGVVAPAQIGGMRLVSEMVRPTVVGFLDTMLRDTNRNLRIEEVSVLSGSGLEGRTVGSLPLHEQGSGLLLLALKEASGDYAFNPPADAVVRAGSTLIVMGDPNSVQALRAR